MFSHLHHVVMSVIRNESACSDVGGAAQQGVWLSKSLDTMKFSLLLWSKIGVLSSANACYVCVQPFNNVRLWKPVYCTNCRALM